MISLATIQTIIFLTIFLNYRVSHTQSAKKQKKYLIQEF